jgi:hypothetical protein
MVVMKYNIAARLFLITLGLLLLTIPAFLIAICGIEMGLWRYVILIIHFISIVKFIRSFKIILNDDGIGREYAIYIFYYPIYKENFLVPWNKVGCISYTNFAFDIDSTELTLWERNMCFKNRKTFHLTFFLTNYREGIAYIVEKVSKGVTKGVVLEFLEYCDITTAYKLKKMGILVAKEEFRAKMGAQRQAKRAAEKKPEQSKEHKRQPKKQKRKLKRHCPVRCPQRQKRAKAIGFEWQ